MADPLLQGRYPVRGLYQALAVAAMCLQEQAATRPLIGDVVTALTYLASQTYDPEAARIERAARGSSGSGTPRHRPDRRNPSDGGGLDTTLDDSLRSPSTYKNSPDYRKRESLREINTRSDIGDGESSNGGGGSGRKWGLVDDLDSQRNSPANTGRARNRDLDRERAVAEAKVWGENWRDRKRTNTIGGSFDATNE